MDQKNQDATEDQIVQHRRGRDADQRCAIIKWNELHAGRERSVAVDSFDLGFDARRDVVGVERPVHDYDSGNDIVFVVAAGISRASAHGQPRLARRP